MPEVFNISVGGDTSKLEKDIQRAAARLKKPISIQVNDRASTALGNITGKTTKFTDALDAATARVVAFGAAAGAFNLVRKGIQELLRATIDVENSLARININLNETEDGIKKFGKEIFNIARETGQTFNVAAEAAEELVRQGLTATETAKRLKNALILGRLAAIDQKQAVDTLTASINSFSKEALNSTEILNKLAAVDARFAVSTKDLADAVSRAGAAASDAGVSFDELLGLVTSVQQTTARGGAVIGNALKSIFTRVGRSSNLESLQELGIAVKDIEGNTLPAIQILKGLADTYDTVSSSQRALIAEQVGGVYQINILKALLSDLEKEYSVFSKATIISAQATDEAFRKNEALNKTLSASFNDLRQSFTELFAAFGQVNLSPILKVFLDGLGSVAKFLAGSKVGEDAGETFGKNILQGFGNFLSGPGVVAFAAIFQSVVSTLTRKVAAEFGEALSTSLLRTGVVRAGINRGSVAGSVKPIGRAANGILPTIRAETSAINSGVGGARPTAKPVLIPNFNFGKGKRGTVVANSDEYIVPNYANGGSAIFNRNMIREMGLPRNAQPLANGFVPNFAIKSKKISDGLLGNVRELSTDSGSSLKYYFDKESKQIGIDYLKSEKKGDAFQLFSSLTKRAKRGGFPIYSGVLESQKRQISRDATNYENLIRIFPQLRYRDQSGLKNSGLLSINNKVLKSNPSVSDLWDDGHFDEKNFKSLSALKSYINKFNRNDFIKKLTSDKITLSDVKSYFAKGFIPNFVRGFRGTSGGGEIRDLLQNGKSISKRFGDSYFATEDTKFIGNTGKDAAATFATIPYNAGDIDLYRNPQDRKGFILGVNVPNAFKAQTGFGMVSPGGLNAKDVEYLQRVSLTQRGDGYKYGPKRNFGRFSQIYNSLFNKRTKLGQSPDSSLANGYIPNFASGLLGAISREMGAGVPLNKIYVDIDKRLSNAKNPSGLLVANTRDEPLGGFQGVNRVLSQGGNPAYSGLAKGFVPNFAPNDGGQFSKESFRGLRGEGGRFARLPSDRQIQQLNKLFDTVRKSSVGSREVTTAFEKILDIEKQFSGQTRGKVTGARLSLAKETRARQILSGETYYTPFEPPTPNSGTSMIAGEYFGPIIEKQREKRNVERSINRRIAISQRDRQYKKEIIKIGLQRDVDSISRGLESGEFFNEKDIERKFKKNIERQVFQNPAFAGLNRKSLNDPRLKNRKALFDTLVAEQYDPIREANERNRNTFKTQRRRRIAQNLTFAGAFAGSTAAAFIPQGEGGTTGGIIGGAASGALQGAATGAFFGLPGVAIGAAFGALVGGLNKSQKSLEEFSKKIDETSNANQKNIQGLDLLATYLEELSKAETPEIRDRVSRKIQDVLPELSKESLDRFKKGFKSQQEIQDFIQDSIIKTNASAKRGEAAKALFATSTELNTGVTGAIRKSAALDTTGFLRAASFIVGGQTNIKQAKETGKIIASIIDKDATELIKQNAGSIARGVNLDSAPSFGDIANVQKIIDKLSEKIPELEGITVDTTNFKGLSISLKTAALNFKELNDVIKESSKNVKAAPLFKNLTSFTNTNFGQEQAFQTFGLSRNAASFKNPNSVRDRSKAFLDTISNLESKGAFGEKGIEGFSNANVEFGKILKQSQAIVAKEGLLEVSENFVKGFGQFKGINTRGERGKISETAVSNLLKTLSTSSDPQTAYLSSLFISQLAEKNKNITESGAKNIFGPTRGGYAAGVGLLTYSGTDLNTVNKQKQQEALSGVVSQFQMAEKREAARKYFEKGYFDKNKPQSSAAIEYEADSNQQLVNALSSLPTSLDGLGENFNLLNGSLERIKDVKIETENAFNISVVLSPDIARFVSQENLEVIKKGLSSKLLELESEIAKIKGSPRPPKAIDVKEITNNYNVVPVQ